MSVTEIFQKPITLARAGQAGQSAGTSVVANISDIIKTSGAKPTGYKGAEGKVVADNGAIKTTAVIEGNDAGFFVAVPPVEAKDAKSLSLYLKGNIFQRQGWDHYASIQVTDAQGKMYILQELCNQGQYESCKGKSKITAEEIKAGKTLNLALPAGLKTIARIEVVFIGDTRVDAGFVMSDIKLVK